MLLTLTARGWNLTLESDVYELHILTSKIDPRIEKVNIYNGPRSTA